MSYDDLVLTSLEKLPLPVKKLNMCQIKKRILTDSFRGDSTFYKCYNCNGKDLSCIDNFSNNSYYNDYEINPQSQLAEQE